MKTIQEEIALAKKYAAGEGWKENDLGFWYATTGWFGAVVENREQKYRQRIDTLERQVKEIEVKFMRRQAE